MRAGHYLIVCLICLVGMGSSAQVNFKAVDRNQVELTVNDASLASFYPTLLDRYNGFDSTLTSEDYRLLYYGFVFQPGYSGYATHRKREMSRALNADHFSEVMRIADSVLLSVPVSLAANYFRGYAMMNENEHDSSYLKYIRRYSGLRDAILCSGDGQRCNSAYKTIFIDDEYEIMFHYFEISTNTAHSVHYPCDRFAVDPSGTYQNSEIFFDASESIKYSEKELNSGLSK